MPAPKPLPRPEAEVQQWEHETDVLIVGLGAAGACAALEARARGRRVMILEAAGGGGGTSANSGGLIYLGGGTPVQKACGFEDTPDDMYKFLVAASGPGAQEDKIRALCDDSVSHFHWLVEQGVPFKESFYPEPGMEAPTDDCLVFSGGENCHPFNRIARPAPRAHKPQVPGAGGAFLMQRLLAAAQKSGAKILHDTRAINLVVANDGAIVGVTARSADGDFQVRAQSGVILCGGGFVSNSEMVELHAPVIARCNVKNGTDNDDGRVIQMAQVAGASVVRMETGEVALPVTIPNHMGKGIFVNGSGQRFINEDTYFGHIGQECLQHQDGEVFLVLDDSTYELNMLKMQPSHVAESIDELEREAGLPNGSLSATVALYNTHAAKGEDPVFHKSPELLAPLENPPFAILDCRAGACIYAGFTTGGLHTSVSGEVLDVLGDPIPGLYAAGRSAALLSGTQYPASGISLADSTLFGRYAGISASQVGS